VISKDQYFMAIANACAARSKDESTQLGAVVVGPSGKIRSTGYNSFPAGIRDDVPARQERPAKYKWFVHAEANAVFLAAREGTALVGGTLYCRWLPCPNCAMAIIQAGITHLVVSSFQVPKRWLGDMEVATLMLFEAGVWVRTPDGVDQMRVTAVKESEECPYCDDPDCVEPETGICTHGDI
jgi:dCMP deaminase